MPGSSQHISIRKATDWEQGWPVVHWDDDGMPHGVTMTDYEVKSQVRPQSGASTVLHEWSTGAGTARIETHDVSVWDLHSRAKHEITTDFIVLRVDPATSAAWTWTHGEYDILTRAPGENGWVDWIDGGTVEAKPTVTVL